MEGVARHDADCCRANLAHIQSRPDSGLGFQGQNLALVFKKQSFKYFKRFYLRSAEENQEAMPARTFSHAPFRSSRFGVEIFGVGSKRLEFGLAASE